MIYVVIDRETITGLSSAKGFTATYIPPTETKTIYAVVQALGKAVRLCIDGTTPEAALGLRLPINSTVEVWGFDALQNFRAIEEAASAKLELIYMGQGG